MRNPGLRVGIVGPARRRSGTGPFVHEALVSNGAIVAALAGREPGAASALLARDDLDAVAICSPADTHESYVAAALRHGLHVFCEKPLVWLEPSPTVARTAALVDGFAASGLVLHENTQWIYTLDDFVRAYPGFDLDRTSRLTVELSPSSGDPDEMIRDAFPHVASLAAALGGTSVEDVIFDWSAAREAMEIQCVAARSGRRALGVRARFARGQRQPRHAAYALDDRWMRRSIGPGYAIRMHAAGSTWNIVDPLHRSVDAFVRAVEGARAGMPPVRADASVSAARMTEAVRLAVRLGAAAT